MSGNYNTNKAYSLQKSASTDLVKTENSGFNDFLITEYIEYSEEDLEGNEDSPSITILETSNEQPDINAKEVSLETESITDNDQICIVKYEDEIIKRLSSEDDDNGMIEFLEEVFETEGPNEYDNNNSLFSSNNGLGSNYVCVEENTDSLKSIIKCEQKENLPVSNIEEIHEEVYHCSSCNTDFESVMQHIRSYHQNEPILIDNGASTEMNADCASDTDHTNDIEFQEKGCKCPENENEELDNLVKKEVEEEVEDECEYFYLDEESTELDSPLGHKRYKRDDSVENNIVIDIGKESKGQEFTCTSCMGVFNSKRSLGVHKRIHKKSERIKKDGDNTSVYKIAMKKDLFSDNFNSLNVKEFDKNGTFFVCSHCMSIFDNYNSYTTHRNSKICNVDRKKDSKVNGKFSKSSTIVLYAEDIYCEVCNTHFPTLKSLKLHKRMHFPSKSKAAVDTIEYDLKAISKEKTTGEMFFCEECNKSYDLIFHDVHRRSHIVGLNHICSVCNKKFNDAMNLEMHMVVHQEMEKTKVKRNKSDVKLPYKCNYCDKEFFRPHEKVKHERIHTGEKPYKCDICGKCFRISYCLTLHLRTHTGARPYVCPHCGKRFKAYSVYNHHLMTHSDERPYKCPRCPKSFKTAVQLAGHKNSHTKPFTCPECNRPFASLYAVKSHVETHKKGSTNFKHKCKYCGAIYARMFALRDHLKEQHGAGLSPTVEESSILDDDEIEIKIENEINIEDEIPVNIIGENEDIISTQAILLDNEEITIEDMEHFQTEEVVTDWLK